MNNHIDPGTRSEKIQGAYPQLSAEQQVEAQARLDAFLNIANDIYKAALLRPGGRATLLLQIRDARAEQHAREQRRQQIIGRPCSILRRAGGGSQRSHVHGC